jgi:glucokinase
MSEVFLAADIGGTNARLALVRGRGDGTVEILEQCRYLCADHPSLDAIVTDFLGARTGIDAMAIGIAGMVNGDEIISRNVPWPIRLAEIRALGIVDVAVVNDFVAVAHAEQCMNDTDTLLLTPRIAGYAPGPTLVIGPGTGLGAALRVSTGTRTLVLPSEPQQMTLAPGNPRELAVLQHWMRAGVAHVGVGHAVSGPGLLNLYRALCELDGVQPRRQFSVDVSSLTEAGGDTHASEAVAMFCGLFGSVVGDLAMITGATRVFVAGGVPSKIKTQLLGGDFAARMVDKDVMRQVLEQVPVRLVEDPNLGVIGAASWFLQSGR